MIALLLAFAIGVFATWSLISVLSGRRRARLLKSYTTGWLDGAQEILRQLVGTSDVPETTPAPQQHVNDELREWAQERLALVARTRITEGVES